MAAEVKINQKTDAGLGELKNIACRALLVFFVPIFQRGKNLRPMGRAREGFVATLEGCKGNFCVVNLEFAQNAAGLGPWSY